MATSAPPSSRPPSSRPPSSSRAPRTALDEPDDALPAVPPPAERARWLAGLRECADVLKERAGHAAATAFVDAVLNQALHLEAFRVHARLELGGPDETRTNPRVLAALDLLLGRDPRDLEAVVLRRYALRRLGRLGELRAYDRALRWSLPPREPSAREPEAS